MTRISKKSEIRGKYPKKHQKMVHVKTGPKKEKGFKLHENVLDSKKIFIPKIKSL